MKPVAKNSKMVMATVLTGMAALSASGDLLAEKKATGLIGKCYGVVGPEEGECGGKDPKTGNSWSCAGQNPTADLGWKSMTEEECDKSKKHAKATIKKFVPN